MAGRTTPTPVTDDGPDLGADAIDTEAPVYTQAEVDELLAQVQAVPTVIPPAMPVLVTGTPAVAPAEPTYEPAEVDEEGTAYAATILASGPDGRQVECTPKAFRLFYAAEGYVAHPLDAAQHLEVPVSNSRRARRSNAEAANPGLAPASRRGRRAAPAAD